jgi:hypothetical protein
MIERLTACALLLCGLCASATANEATPAPSAYRAVMDAQYAARQQPLPARPEETQRIYENYLESIGKPARGPSTDLDASIPTPSR